MLENERDATGIVTKLFEHNEWANLKLLGFCEGLSDEHLDSTAIGCFGSIRETLGHIIRGEVSYVVRVNGKLPPAVPAAGESVGFEAMKDMVRWSSQEMLQLALSARKDTLVHEREGEWVCQYNLSSLMVQAVTHSTEHRTQIAAIITQLGTEPPDMSVWNYIVGIEEFRETRKPVEGVQE
ncbi:MAG TPA: DinB family protein [Chloroflexia bacterium]|nr:DinB family protein [Chloroflexia bacterium]